MCVCVVQHRFLYNLRVIMRWRLVQVIRHQGEIMSFDLVSKNPRVGYILSATTML